MFCLWCVWLLVLYTLLFLLFSLTSYNRYMKIQKFNNGYVDLRIVRAFAKTQEVQEKTGVLVDFSAKLVMVQTDKKGEVVSETVTMALNGLNVRADRRSVLYVGSLSNSYIDSRNEKQTVYALTMFPGQDDKTDEQLATEDKFMDELMDEIYAFIEKARNQRDSGESKTRKAKLPDTPAVTKFRELGKTIGAEANAKRQAAEATGKGDVGGTGDIPF